MKLIVPVNQQWAAFRHLEQMVSDGSIALPRHVINEVGHMTHPDMPGAWATGMRDRSPHSPQADYAYLCHVMKVSGDVVDVNKASEDADPWVLALALQLQESMLLKICVVTEDTVDRNRISMITACERLNLRSCQIRDFLDHCGITMRSAPPNPEDA